MNIKIGTAFKEQLTITKLIINIFEIFYTSMIFILEHGLKYGLKLTEIFHSLNLKDNVKYLFFKNNEKRNHRKFFKARALHQFCNT